MDFVEICLTKARLFLTEAELVSLLAKDPDLWTLALKRGKSIIRGRKKRESKVKKEFEA